MCLEQRAQRGCEPTGTGVAFAVEVSAFTALLWDRHILVFDIRVLSKILIF